jgi:protein TonB
MKNPTVIHADLNDILFDDRNKAYGAYHIRKEYPKTIMNAFYITFATALTIVLVGYAMRDLPLADLDLSKGIVNLYEVNVDRPLPKLPEPETKAALPLLEEKSEPAPKAKGMDTQESANVNPTPDADPDATIAPDSAYKDKQPGETTTDSSSSTAIGGDPHGTGKEGNEAPCKDCEPGDGTGGNGAGEPDPFKPFLGEMPIPGNIGDIRKLIGYPRDARDAQLEGKVTYRVLVDEKGNYVRHMVLRSSHPLFDKACARHLSGLKFTPGKMGDRSVPCWVVLPFNFKLMH